VQRYQPWHRRRLEVAPGLTGLWQVSGRSNLTFDEAVLLDLYYIENWSLLLDMQLMLRTLPKLVSGEGAY
jgi:lipopolysaccharide/colanic/teichoic acid biosynthesis glycosyltransferase